MRDLAEIHEANARAMGREMAHAELNGREVRVTCILRAARELPLKEWLDMMETYTLAMRSER